MLGAGVWFTLTHEHTIVRVIDGLLISAGITVGIVLALTAIGLVRVFRRESVTQIAWSRPAIKAGAVPPPTAKPIEGRPVQAITAPPTEVHNHFYGVTPEQVADALLRRGA